MEVILINDVNENWKWLAYSIWLQGLKDLKNIKKWLLNEGRKRFVPHLSISEVERIINEYLQ